MRLSIIIPTLNEAELLAETLEHAQDLRGRGHEVILVDGGSTDSTRSIAEGKVDRLVRAQRGRARQMNAGARNANGEVLLFLHADTWLPERADNLICEGMARGGFRWGRFDVRLSPGRLGLGVIAWLMNLRSRLSGIATGDQAIFVERALFESVGGFPDIPLMEDVKLSQALKAVGRPLCMPQRVITSSRRWLEKGIFTTVLAMWRLRLAFALGADPRRLHRSYHRSG